MGLGPNIETDGLVFMYDASNIKSYISGSTTAYNLLDNSESGTLVNGLEDTSTNGVWDMDGTDDSINLGTTAHNTLLTTDVDLTIEGYVKASDVSGNQSVIAKQSNPTTYTGFNLYFDGNKLRWLQGTSSGYDTVTANNLSANTWYHFVLTKPSGFQVADIKMYIDSVNSTVVGVDNWNGANVGNGQTLFIGTRQAGSPFHGGVGFIKIYNRILSQSEVTNNYNTHKRKFGIK
jgi:hypothetical protein